ncbi:type II toxin-antitoxin system RelE/ParE family toxin [Bradyrhizobium sp.]|uniref:type II toxin-antitoxin system RelE/ParE family toxin n=1 Tax=Bradyrhizobium sp. TaxID=376 RepID=UPI002CCEBFB6|nr:type II toxin-antitoxin system RelE/ParE family toxin [Bradyrhizobium sp.]HWX61877.1 type II toxin-antitoxin system RelE/ParE family toxin [Bradyrhizobium sp.]
MFIRAIADLDGIASSCYSTKASPAIARSVEHRFTDDRAHPHVAPESAPRVTQRSHVRVVSVVRYPFRIFYRVRGDTIGILHIRHTSRRPQPIEDHT